MKEFFFFIFFAIPEKNVGAGPNIILRNMVLCITAKALKDGSLHSGMYLLNFLSQFI